MGTSLFVREILDTAHIPAYLVIPCLFQAQAGGPAGGGGMLGHLKGMAGIGGSQLKVCQAYAMPAVFLIGPRYLVT
jgi:hypothetical protein